MSDAEDKRAVIINNLKKKGIEFQVTFNTVGGKKVLEALRQEFMPTEMAVKDPTQTIINAARRDIIDYIERLVKLGEENVD